MMPPQRGYKCLKLRALREDKAASWQRADALTCTPMGCSAIKYSKPSQKYRVCPILLVSDLIKSLSL